VDNMSESENLRNYVRLMSLFLNGELSASDFQKQYLGAFKADETLWQGDIYLILDRVFAETDSYCSDNELRQQLCSAIDDKELYRFVNIEYEKLVSICDE